MDAIERALAYADAHIGESIERLFALLRIPSISTDPNYAGDCRAAAEWLRAEISSLGFKASVRETKGHPVVVGHLGGDSKPHVLFYGHYDVQPVDPVELWQSPPFEPVLFKSTDGREQIRARGASDDKGQLMTFVEACRALLAGGGTLPVQVSLLFEGEEESGGISLPAFLEENREELSADVALVCDTDMWSREVPAITTMLRGLCAEEIIITSADRDLHSGMYGNAARNPNQVVAEIIASLRAPDGRVAIEGFYEDVEELPAAVSAQWATLGFDATGFLRDVGLSAPAGEDGRTVLEQVWARPSCEINGMSGGYVGDGFKTVIPSTARAKISFRLVADQDPEKIRAAFRAHVKARVPADCQVEFIAHGGARAIRVASDGPFVSATREALTSEWGHEAAIIGSGGSIPVVGEFKRRLGMDSLLVGFALEDNNIHSPNEKYDLVSFHKGVRSWIRILGTLGER